MVWPARGDLALCRGSKIKPGVGIQKNLHHGGFFVSAEGLEPSTNGLKGRCSAIELRARLANADFTTNKAIEQGLLLIFYGVL